MTFSVLPFLPPPNPSSECHLEGHVFKFYCGESVGYCVYCGELRHLDAYDNKAYMTPGGKEASS